jgi:hypothetical protein
MADSRIKNAGTLLSAFFDEDKLKKGSSYAEFFASWTYLAGERLAAHSRIVDVDKGMLVVEAEHPGWIQLLQLRQSEILEGVSSRFPELGLRGIVFRLGQMRGMGPGLEAHRPPGPFGPGAVDRDRDEAARAERDQGEAQDADGSPRSPPSLEDIADPGLRSLLAGLKDSIEGKDRDSKPS